VVVNDGTIANNSSVSAGGGIAAGPSTLVFLRNTASVSFNTLASSSSLGGGIHTSGYLQATDAFFQRNVSEKSGGGLYLEDIARARIDRSTFFENDGGKFGGGIFNDGFMYVTDTVFQSNTVTDTGGAYFTTPTSNTLVSGLSFTGNIPDNFN
jgi:predicted outer membrane repeat protein